MSFTGSTFGNYSRLYLIILGVIFLVVGGGMFIFAGSAPFVGGTMSLIGGIFALVGGILIVVGIVVGRSAAATNQLLQTGIAGTATITSLTQTGVYLNEQPQIAMDLMVSLPGRPPYAARHHEIVPLMMLGRLSSGAPLSVRVDPVNPLRLAIDWQGTGFSPVNPMAAMGIGAAPMMGGVPVGTPAMGTTASGTDESLSQVQAALASSGMQAAAPFQNAAQGNFTVEQLRAYLRQNGVPATATIDSLEDSGKVVGNERLFTMGMTLNMPGQPPKKLPTSAAMVPITSAYKLAKGMSVPVRYAAENPDLLMVEWDKI